MTVYNTSYSSIDEAWGDSYLAPPLQKSKSKKKKQPPASDPICELYDMGSNAYTENDIVSYANKFYEKHDKSKYQIPRMNTREPGVKRVDFPVDDNDDYAYVDVPQMMNDEPTDELKRLYMNSHSMFEDQPAPKSASSSSLPAPPPEPPSSSHVTEVVEVPREDIPSTRNSLRNKILYDTHEYYVGDDDPDFYKKNANFNHFDVILYVISGIILIFMMEQFVKIGTMLH